MSPFSTAMRIQRSACVNQSDQPASGERESGVSSVATDPLSSKVYLRIWDGGLLPMTYPVPHVEVAGPFQAVTDLLPHSQRPCKCTSKPLSETMPKAPHSVHD